MFSYISSLFSDPRSTLIVILLAFPGRILAISAHAYAQAWVADRCGDRTPRQMGRLTMNPFTHLDLTGTILMLLVGFGWAKPMPIDPRNFKNLRKNSFQVALAGIVLNLIFFLLGSLICAVLALVLLGKSYIPGYNRLLVENATMLSASYIATEAGQLVSYLYQMLQYFIICNIALTLFNLLPIPPLDGYIAISTAIKRPLYRSANGMRIASAILFALLLTGALGRVMGTVISAATGAVGALNAAIFSLLGLI